MSNKAEKPTLSGTRIKTRKRDEKEKYDPFTFRKEVLAGLSEAKGDLEQVSKWLDITGSKLDYRRYAEPLFDILIAGGILAPGGSLVEEGDKDGLVERSPICVFASEADFKSLKAYYEVFYKLIRRYKYLEKIFDDSLSKMILFLKGFSETDRCKLGMFVGITLANGLGTGKAAINLLTEDHLVKDGLSLDFATHMFSTWLQQKDINSIAGSLKKISFENKLMLLLPINKRTHAAFEAHFKSAGLMPIVNFQRTKANHEQKKILESEIEMMLKDDEPVKEMTADIKERMSKSEDTLPEHEVVVMVWNALVSAVEWNKKEELVAEQAMKHLRQYSPLFGALTNSARSEMALMLKVQSYCYDNMDFMKVFSKIILLFYKTDVLSEDIIVKWYKESHSDKGKSVFLDQMKSMVEWLEQAEEEDSDEDED